MITEVTSDNKKPLLTLEEVADYLRVNTMTVRRMIQRGSIPSIRVEGSLRISPEDLSAYVEKMKTAN